MFSELNSIFHLRFGSSLNDFLAIKDCLTFLPPLSHPNLGFSPSGVRHRQPLFVVSAYWK